jgi:hypothetical protein
VSVTKVAIQWYPQRRHTFLVGEVMKNKHIVVWFSCGAASAVAAKETIRVYGEP